MALAGALIVMGGLSFLSFVISQLHRVIALFEKGPTEPMDTKTSPDAFKSSDFPLFNLEEAARRCMSQTASLGEPFDLKSLFETLKEKGWPASHLTVRAFREAGILVPAGNGLFTWKK